MWGRGTYKKGKGPAFVGPRRVFGPTFGGSFPLLKRAESWRKEVLDTTLLGPSKAFKQSSQSPQLCWLTLPMSGSQQNAGLRKACFPLENKLGFLAPKGPVWELEINPKALGNFNWIFDLEKTSGEGIIWKVIPKPSQCCGKWGKKERFPSPRRVEKGLKVWEGKRPRNAQSNLGFGLSRVREVLTPAYLVKRPQGKARRKNSWGTQIGFALWLVGLAFCCFGGAVRVGAVCSRPKVGVERALECTNCAKRPLSQRG